MSDKTDFQDDQSTYIFNWGYDSTTQPVTEF